MNAVNIKRRDAKVFAMTIKQGDAPYAMDNTYTATCTIRKAKPNPIIKQYTGVIDTVTGRATFELSEDDTDIQGFDYIADVLFTNGTDKKTSNDFSFIVTETVHNS